jgi:hypothetical protein
VAAIDSEPDGAVAGTDCDELAARSHLVKLARGRNVAWGCGAESGENMARLVVYARRGECKSTRARARSRSPWRLGMCAHSATRWAPGAGAPPITRVCALWFSDLTSSGAHIPSLERRGAGGGGQSRAHQQGAHEARRRHARMARAWTRHALCRPCRPASVGCVLTAPRGACPPTCPQTWTDCTGPSLALGCPRHTIERRSSCLVCLQLASSIVLRCLPTAGLAIWELRAAANRRVRRAHFTPPAASDATGGVCWATARL